MNTQRDLSVGELREKSEQSRAALADRVAELREKVSDTADDLKARLSPAHIKKEVKDYVRQESEDLLSSVERKARQNPLQAVAIGAGLAYPLWGVLKTIPAPIMLVGTGLWLSRQKSRTGSGPDIVRRISDAGAEAVEQIGQSVQEATSSVSATAQAVTDQVGATAHDIYDSVVRAGGSVVRAGGAATTAVKDSAGGATDAVSVTAQVLKDKGVQLANQSSTAIEELVHRNPLLIGGLALAVGAFIAASLPASEAENRIFGKRSDEVKDKALEAVADGVERAKDLAAGMVGDVAEAAARENLNMEGLAKGVKSVAQGVKSVMDKGLDSALGPEAPPAPSPITASHQE